MLKYLLGSFVPMVVACSTTDSLRLPASVSGKPIHYVVTLHGVRGTAESFGAFHSIAKASLEKIDPNYEVTTVNWTYPVGSKVEDSENKVTWTGHKVALRLNEELFLGANAKIPALRDGDKISFIAYSMGGMMIMNWYYDTMFNFPTQKDLQYAPADYQRVLGFLEKTENIIGLGAVYWGSIDAELGWAFMESGDTTQILKLLPKFRNFCARDEIQQIVNTTSLTEGLMSGSNNNKTVDGTNDGTNDTFVKKSIKVACEALNALPSLGMKTSNKRLPANFYDDLKAKIRNLSLSGIEAILTTVGNVSPHELDNMRLTSDLINGMRVSRIRHLVTPEYAQRFKTRWSSIIGVFPCLGKADQSTTCTKFKSADFKKINDGLVSIFSGLKRRETDGAVISSSADADFLFYSETEGRQSPKISASEFRNTADLQQGPYKDQQIYVENMHASLVPVLEGLSGALKSVGTSGASAMKHFDASLGVDVAVIPSACAEPATCKHPNYKHVLNLLATCDSGTGQPCAQQYLNEFFGIGGIASKLADSRTLRQEMGSFVLTLNIRLPKDYSNLDDVKANYLKYFKFKLDASAGKTEWTENRLDSPRAPYALQIAREREIMSSYISSATYPDSTVLRVYFVGRAWAKDGRNTQAQALLAKGVPVPLEITLPGVQPRIVEAAISPALSTYVDLFMK